MTFLRLALFIILTPLFLASVWWVVWAFIELFHDDDLRVHWCACGARVLADGRPACDMELVVHGRAVCQPLREWIPTP